MRHVVPSIVVVVSLSLIFVMIASASINPQDSANTIRIVGSLRLREERVGDPPYLDRLRDQVAMRAMAQLVARGMPTDQISQRVECAWAIADEYIAQRPGSGPVIGE